MTVHVTKQHNTTHTSAHPQLHTRVYQKVPRLDLQTRMYLLDFSSGSIPFKTVPMCSDTLIPVPLPLLEHVLEVLFSKRTKIILGFPLDLLHSVKAATLQLQLHLREEEEVARGQIQWVRRMWKCDNAVVGEKLTHYENFVRGCIVIMEQPIARAPQFRSFSPNVLPHTAKNTAVEPGVHGLAFRGKFTMHNPSNVEKHDEHTLGRGVALPRLLWSWGSWALPLQRLLFSLRIIPIDPALIPSDDHRHEGWVIQGMLMKILTNCNSVLFLFGSQKPGNELCSNVVHVQITHENCLHYSVWHNNDCSNVLNGSPMILMHKPPNCFHIFRCWARGRSPWPVIVFKWCFASLEARVPLETPRTTYGLISTRTPYHFKSHRSRFAEFHAEFDVCSLLQFHVHAEIANVKAQVVTNTRVVQLPKFTQQCHSAYWVATFPAPKHSPRIHILPSVGVLWN